VAFSNDDFGDLLVESLKVIDFLFGVFGHEWWGFDFAVMIIPSRIPFMYEFLPWISMRSSSCFGVIGKNPEGHGVPGSS
jgi:hypothetical protein